MSSSVNPDHYGTASGLQAIDVIEAFFLNNALRANSFKYLARAGRKDDELQELSKALWYVAREILRIGGQQALDLAVKELPGEKTLATNIPAKTIERMNTFDSLGEGEQIEGVVYKDKDGDFWTWRVGCGWEVLQLGKWSNEWVSALPSSGEEAPYERTFLIPDEVA